MREPLWGLYSVRNPHIPETERKLAECWGPGSMGWPPLVSCIAYYLSMATCLQLSSLCSVPPSESTLTVTHYLLPPSGSEVDSPQQELGIWYCASGSFWVLLCELLPGSPEQRGLEDGRKAAWENCRPRRRQQMVQRCILLPYTSVLFRFYLRLSHSLNHRR